MRPITPFRFKQFSISHNQCAHKVGTDGVLLGAWVNANNAQSILDIGTGSGLIALMLAQRFPESVVIGIELDHPSFLQAQANSANSPFAKRVHIIHDDFIKHNFNQKFDLIVSNPPFYRGNTSTGKTERDRARHEEHLPQSDFLEKTVQLLNPTGKLAVVLPKEEGEHLIEEALKKKLFPSKLTRVFGAPNAPEKRWLIEFSFENTPRTEDTLMVRNENGDRSEGYKTLTKDFYL